MVKASFQIFGDSGDGKTALLGEFAKWVLKESGGKIDLKPKKPVPGSGKITRVCTADSGGWLTVQPLVDLGIMEIVPLQTLPNPFSWVSHVVRGEIPVMKDGKVTWVKKVDGVGVFAFEGITAFADCLLKELANKAAAGVNIGGGGAFNFKDGDLTVGSNNMGHYSQVQSAITSAVSASQWLLPDDAFVIWTAMARRGEDENSMNVLGPQAAGKALTPDLPRWFQYTFRVSADPTDDGRVIHRLYMDDHKDKMLRGAKGLGNSRLPLDVPKAKLLPPFIEPASLVKAYQMIQDAYGTVEGELLKELGV